MRHGWLAIPGLQTGDRTIEEQMIGLDQALAAAKGKTVLDLGCAEGGIAREFAKAGAKKVLGVELLADHIKVARRVCRGQPVEFVCAELAKYIDDNQNHEQFDVVLALSVAHKLHDPGKLITFAARSAREMVAFRGPGKKDGKGSALWDGWLKAKFGDGKCHVPTLFQAEGFVEGETLDSARGERVQYWRRK